MPEIQKNERVSISIPDATNAPRNLSVDSIISESQNSITSSIQKRGRGRPRKIEAVTTPNGQGSTGHSGSPSITGNMPTTAQPTVKIPKEALKPAIELPFKYSAVKTGFDGFNLSPEESDALAEQLDLVIRQYMPAAQSPHAALYVFCGTLGIMSLMRYMQYLDWVKLKSREVTDVKNA